MVVTVVPSQDPPLQVANGALVESARETASKHNQVRLGDFMMLEGSTFVSSTESFQGCQGLTESNTFTATPEGNRQGV